MMTKKRTSNKTLVCAVLVLLLALSITFGVLLVLSKVANGAVAASNA